MIRDERYCDACGTQMTYQDSDGNTSQQGIILNTTIVANIQYRTNCGESGSARTVHCTDFCSVACFDLVLGRWVEQVRDAAKNMEALK